MVVSDAPSHHGCLSSLDSIVNNPTPMPNAVLIEYERSNNKSNVVGAIHDLMLHMFLH